MSEGFVVDAETAELFFQICQELKLDKEEERVQLLRLLVKEKRAGYIRDVESYTKDKNVLRIKSGGNNAL